MKHILAFVCGYLLMYSFCRSFLIGKEQATWAGVCVGVVFELVLIAILWLDASNIRVYEELERLQHERDEAFDALMRGRSK